MVGWLAHSLEVSDYDHVTRGLCVGGEQIIMVGRVGEQSGPPHDKQEQEKQDTSNTCSELAIPLVGTF